MGSVRTTLGVEQTVFDVRRHHAVAAATSLRRSIAEAAEFHSSGISAVRWNVCCPAAKSPTSRPVVVVRGSVRRARRVSDRQTIRLLRESAAILPLDDIAHVHSFYQRLFELAPETRQLFKRDMTLQTSKFREMLVWMLEHIDDGERLTAALEDLGRRHAQYGGSIDHYAAVGSALIWMFSRSGRDSRRRWRTHGSRRLPSSAATWKEDNGPHEQRNNDPERWQPAWRGCTLVGREARSAWRL
jgi:hypothetical protein